MMEILARTPRAPLARLVPLRIFRDNSREAILFGLICLMAVAINWRAPEYLAPKNFDNLLYNLSFLAILALGQLPVLLSRGIDLSQASVLALTGMLLALLSQGSPDLPAFAHVALALALGALLGATNGLFIAFLRIPPIIMTLGTMTVYRGLIYLLSGGAWVSSFEMSDAFKSIGAMRIAGLPLTFAIMIVATAGIWYLLSATRSGRNVYAVGGNPVAARLVGISERKVELLVYALSGMAAGLCGYLWTAHFAIAYTQAAEGREFAIVASCVIGGVSIAGGKGTVPGAFLGALFITVIDTSLPFLRISPFMQMAIIGAVILIAVAANAQAERQPGRQILRRSDEQNSGTEISPGDRS
ncbi:MAG TPA: ABC transporter permease [Devosiaceae bacterium]